MGREAVLRLKVIPASGCKGFSYAFELNDPEQVQPSDTVIERGGARVVVDADSMPFLQGSVVDFESGTSRHIRTYPPLPSRNVCCRADPAGLQSNAEPAGAEQL
jgi:iron-sulfur cluster assembly accessory protein